MGMMRPEHQMIRAAISGFVLALALFVSTGFSAAGEIRDTAISIHVHKTAAVTGPLILLGEIAQIQAPPFFVDELAGLELGRSPKPGRMKPISGEKIHSLIRARGLDKMDMIVDIPKQVFVKRKSQVLSDARVQKAFFGFLSGFFPHGELKIKGFRVGGIDPYPEGELSLVFDPRYTPGNKGRLSVHADVMVAGVKVDRVTVNGRMALYKPVVCAARPLAKGEIISRKDILLKSMNVFELRPGFLETLDDALNMALTSGLETGDCVTRRGFKKAPVIRKGDVVRLVAQKKMLSIVTLGISREDGYSNRPVMVENLRSGKLVRGMVKDNGTVEVIF